ncbi:MAG: hypothetical protein L0Z07_06475 [Planctomycetes bacterium]|nr:hypothetical protein [Planctomycetota bacterium]
MSKILLSAVLVGLLITSGRPAMAAEELEKTPVINDEAGDYYQYPQPRRDEPDARAIIRQKAMVRSEQRQARLASMAWYGMCNARPTAAPTPFTTLYSPVWQMPGGRPFAWYLTSRPTYVYLAR